MAVKPITNGISGGGDDLDDGLELDASLIASDAEGSSGSSYPVDEDEDEGSMSEGVYEDREEEIGEGSALRQQKASVQAGAKRKAESADNEEEIKAERKRRKKQKEKERKARRRQEASPAATGKPLSQLSKSELSALLVSSIRDTFPSASPMEISDMTIPEDRLAEPLSNFAPDVEDPFSELSQYVNAVVSQKKLPVSTPRVIILCLSGLRCADVARNVKAVKASGEVAKLFAKHFKVDDQIKYLSKTRVSVAVGTPARVGKLLAEEALKVTSNTLVLLDASHHDSKKRTLLTLPEARQELWKSVFSGPAKDILFNGQARIGAF